MNGNNRESILRKFGLTEDDVRDSEKLFKQMPPPPPPKNMSCCSKEERLLGYTMMRIKREKALRVLGASEEDVDIENSKNLGALGQNGRKRSFFVLNQSSVIPKRMTPDMRTIGIHHRARSFTTPSYRKQSKTRRRRRSSSGFMIRKLASREVIKLKRQNEDANSEIVRLKERLENLEQKMFSKTR